MVTQWIVETMIKNVLIIDKLPYVIATHYLVTATLYLYGPLLPAQGADMSKIIMSLDYI